MFDRLFEPISIGPVTLKNRIQLLPHNTLFDIQTLIPYLARRAQGGAGLIEVSLATPIRDVGEFPAGAVDAWPYKGYDREIIPHYRMLSKAIHDHGAKVFVELAAAGGNRSAKRGVSPVPGGSLRVTPRQFTEGEIERLVEDHAVAARYIRDGGMDGLDLHGTHGMLLEEFYSKATNHRSDRYGGSLENRVRVIKEIIARVKESTAGEIAIGMRIDADDKFPHGNNLQDQVELARSLDGLLDLINVDIGFEHQSMHIAIAPMYQEPGYQLYATRAIKAAVRKSPIGAAGRILDPVLAEQILESGDADLIGMTRALIADPDLPNKARAGRLDEIRICLGDNQRCVGNMLRGLEMRCTINPLVGREGDRALESFTQAERRKRVLVIGGGVAGMEVARVCRERGHEVVLYERNDRLGGNVNLASKLPGRDSLLAIVRWYEGQLKRLGVDLRLNVEIPREKEAVSFLLADANPGCVVLATGSSPNRDGMQSFNYEAIKGHEFATTIDDVLGQDAKVGRSVVILDESGFVEAVALASKLAASGSGVEVVTRDVAPALETQWSLQIPYLYESALKLKVVFTPNTFIREIGPSFVRLYNIYTGEETLREGVDNVILNTGRTPRDDLFALFSGAVGEVHTVGECNLAGRQIGDSISEAFDLARAI